MTITYIIVGIIALCIISNYFKKRKKSDPLFHQIRDRVKADLEQANFANDWKERQKLNLQLHWLDTIKEVKLRDMFDRKKEGTEESILSKLSKDEIQFPQKWSLNNIYHFPYVQGIIAEYGKTLANNKYQSEVYKPNSILPFHKNEIKKSFHYLFDVLNQENALYSIPNKSDYAEKLNNVKLYLYMSFLDIDEKELPSEGINNALIGSSFQGKKSELSEIDELDLIDWRDDELWISSSINHMQNNAFDYAEKCLQKAENMNQMNKDIRKHFGLLYLCKAEHLEESGEEDKGIENRELAQEYGVNSENISDLFNIEEEK